MNPYGIRRFSLKYATFPWFHGKHVMLSDEVGAKCRTTGEMGGRTRKTHRGYSTETLAKRKTGLFKHTWAEETQVKLMRQEHPRRNQSNNQIDDADRK